MLHRAAGGDIHAPSSILRGSGGCRMHVLRGHAPARDRYEARGVPARTLRVRSEHAQIGDDMLFVVDREHGIRWRNIGNVWICRWFFHERVIERMIPTPADLADLL